MSLRHGLLGLLAEGPASGYDLSRRFQEVLGALWPAQHPKIYAELGRMVDGGLIDIDSHGPRGRKAYRITEAGRAEVRRWLTQVDVDHTVRLEALLRSYFFWLMEPDDLARHLAREAEFYTEQAAIYRAYAERKDAGEFGSTPQVQSMRITIEGGVRVYEALAEWARWAATYKLPAAADGGAPEDGTANSDDG
ncbi:PadR family transcriptional regulator [Rugosimonospora africana]|uniref:PadR family transcriptional regulator n=1 Tax=Rugosimonospora africana TaxID=556532 RepID=A0A8J3QUX6_9ACTN|nr:PadR family transcriptional regulator [Rugosimonospora africana]GIH16265.1 PadR family transcriptional regulator [Rugosimonospora africana]